jgi:hypothetical protein
MGLLTHSSRRSLPSHWRLRVTTRGSSESVPAGKVQRGPGIASPRQDRLRSGRCCLPIRFGPLPSGFLNGACGLADDIEYEGGVREHGDVAAGGLDGDGSHALRHEAFQLGLYGAVLGGHDVPARLRPPSGAPDLLVEQVRRRCSVGRPHDLLLLLGQVSREARDAFRPHPDAPVRDFDVRKDVCDGELGLLALRRFVGVRREDEKLEESLDDAELELNEASNRYAAAIEGLRQRRSGVKSS